MNSKVQLKFDQILPLEFINKGNYLLGDVFRGKKIPDFDMKKGDETGHTFLRIIDDSIVDKLMRLFSLCYFNNPAKNKDRAALAYGKIFMKHYELEQRILDSFDGANKSDENKIIEILNAAKGKFEGTKKELRDAFVPEPAGPGIQFIKLDLTKEDSSKPTHQPEEFSELLQKINPALSDTAKSYEVLNWKLNDEVLNHLHRRMSKAYGALLIRNCAREILKDVKNHNMYKSRTFAETNKEAARDFLQKRLGRGLTDGQCAYQIFLKYYKGLHNNKLVLMSTSSGDTKYNALRSAVKKIRSNP